MTAFPSTLRQAIHVHQRARNRAFHRGREAGHPLFLTEYTSWGAPRCFKQKLELRVYSPGTLMKYTLDLFPALLQAPL
jgi:hypothetical protein